METITRKLFNPREKMHKEKIQSKLALCKQYIHNHNDKNTSLTTLRKRLGEVGMGAG